MANRIVILTTRIIIPTEATRAAAIVGKMSGTTADRGRSRNSPEIKQHQHVDSVTSLGKRE